MADSLSTPGSPLILSLVLGRRHPGFAVLDGFGLAHGGFRSWNLQATEASRRPRLLAAKVRRLLVRFRPGFVVLGVPPGPPSGHRAPLRTVCRLLARARVPFTLHTTTEAHALLLGRSRQRRRDELASVLLREFTLTTPTRSKTRRVRPEARVFRDHGRVRRHRSAWSAVALGVCGLARRHPFAAGALLRAGARGMPHFEALLTASAKANLL